MIASVVMLLIMAAVFGRSLISAAYVNAAAVVLTHAEGQSACALGLPYSSLQPAKRDQAIAFLRQALLWNTNNERAWRLTGEIALNQGDLLEASQAFAKVRPRTVVFSLSQFWQAYADTERGDTLQSRAWTSSGAERFLLAVGDCFNANEQFEQAQHYYTIARDDANSMIASTRLGDLLTNQGRLDEALTSYRYVIAQSQDAALLAGAYMGVGQILVRQEKAAEADTQFGEAYSLTPSGALASKIGLILRDSKQYERSNTWLRVWMERSPTSPDPYRVLGTNALDNGQPAEAVHYFNDAIEYGGKSPDLYYHLGNAYEALGDVAKARQAYERVLAINAGHTNAKKRLESLN